jgi:hypothetical protein
MKRLERNAPDSGTIDRLLAVFVGLVLLLQSHRAWAYLDPATGSLIVQAIVGGFLAAIVTLRLYWRRLRGFLSGQKTHGAVDDR